MPNFYGDWFHSRTGSQLSELAAIKKLVEASNKFKFIGKNWGADRRNPKNKWIYDFSAQAKVGDESIQPSTMQTKIRNWIRLGFIKDGSQLPLKWTQLGLLWFNSINQGNGMDTNIIYRLIIANALSTFSFTPGKKGFDDIPNEDGLIIKNLIKIIKSHDGYISEENLKYLIDGDTERKTSKNYTYWKTDLINSGLFKEDSSNLVINNYFNDMIISVENYIPSDSLTTESIKNNPLSNGAPFRNALIQEFKKYGSPELIDAVLTISHSKSSNNDKSIGNNVISRKQIKRSPKWSKSVKDNYSYKCAIPGCDSEGKLFIQAAHIMPFSIDKHDSINYHRNDVNNGIALCLSCHKLFDAGLFTFDKNGVVIPSKFIYSNDDVTGTFNQVNIMRVLNSRNKSVKIPENMDLNEEYIYYHEENIFLGE